jgi:Coenzyme PQQ synthesis protein D (PqqD)
VSISESTTVVAARDQISSRLGEEAVVLDLSRGRYYGLNEVGSRIWQLLAEPRRAGAIRDAVLAEYDVDPETCTRDVFALLERLIDRSLVEVRDDSAH